VSRCRRGGIPIWGRIEGVLVVRRQTLVGLALVGAIYTNIPATTPASAGWCDCGYRAYDYYAPRVYSRMYSYAYTPLLYRDYRPAYFYSASFYRPRVWDGAHGVDGIRAGADDDIGDGAAAGAGDTGGGVGRVALSS
jgi:hypothetical protein